MTTSMQFQTLVKCMEEFPELITGCTQSSTNSSKAAMEQTWETVAMRINEYGPPVRSASEWRKVWADLKCRLKKKIAENNKSLKEGDGSSRFINLTELENDIDRICHISAAAASSGRIFGLPDERIVSTKKIAVVTPTSSGMFLEANHSEMLPNITFNSEEPIPSNKCRINNIYTITPKEMHFNRKRKRAEMSNERIKLLRQESELQAETLKVMKYQTEAAKECALSMQQLSGALKTQSESIKTIAECMEMMTKGMFDIVKHLTKK